MHHMMMRHHADDKCKPGKRHHYGWYVMHHMMGHDDDDDDDHDDDDHDHGEIALEGSVDLKDGNDVLISMGDTGQTIYLGDGDNLAYFLGTMAGNLTGGEDRDTIVTLGNAGTMNRSTLWDLNEGDNAVYINRNCYANIKVDDGNDLFVIGGDAAKDCTIQSGDGKDLILVGGVLSTLVDTGDDDDFVVIDATTETTPTINTGSGSDVVVFESVLKTNVSMGDGDDRIVLQKGIDNTVNTLDGGDGNDVLEVPLSKAEWENSALRYKVSDIETIKLTDGIISNP